MIYIPEELPGFVHMNIGRNDAAFLRGKRWEPLRNALAEAATSGLERRACRALLLGVKSCEDWRDNSKRLLWLKLEQQAAEVRRDTLVFKDAEKKREIYTERFLELVQTLIMLGYIVANDCQRVERAHWYPLAPAFELILTIGKPKDTEYDPKKQLVGIVQKRLIRLRGKCGGKLPFEAAEALFQEVYDTF